MVIDIYLGAYSGLSVLRNSQLRNSQSSFLLSKWYVDLVDDAGNLFIIYIGKIKLGRLQIHYSSMLKKLPGLKPVETYTLKKYIYPEIEADNFSWKSEELHCELNYSQTGESITKKLIDIPEGYIWWHCLHPRSLAEIIVNGKERYKGYGYVERLDMTIKPWMLPFNELRWGRFLSDDSSVIWIDYKGTRNCSLIFRDGEEYNDAAFFEDKIMFNSDKDVLSFTGPSDIKKGEIISSTFSKIPVINKVIPQGLLRIFEHKSVAKTAFCTDRKPVSSGWAIFELVKWL